MRHWPYYTNVYYKYTHGSFNINNEIYYYFTKKLHIISFVKIIIVKPKNQNWYPKLNVPYFWNYYVYYNTRPESAPKGVTIVCFTHLGEKVWIFFTHNCNHWCHPPWIWYIWPFTTKRVQPFSNYHYDFWWCTHLILDMDIFSIHLNLFSSLSTFIPSSFLIPMLFCPNSSWILSHTFQLGLGLT